MQGIECINYYYHRTTNVNKVFIYWAIKPWVVISVRLRKIWQRQRQPTTPGRQIRCETKEQAPDPDSPCLFFSPSPRVRRYGDGPTAAAALPCEVTRSSSVRYPRQILIGALAGDEHTPGMRTRSLAFHAVRNRATRTLT